MRNTSVLIAAIICCTLLLFGFFIWPTPYSYHTKESGYVWRVTRCTGNAIVIRPRP